MIVYAKIVCFNFVNKVLKIKVSFSLKKNRFLVLFIVTNIEA